jgi:hypothetical protein
MPLAPGIPEGFHNEFAAWIRLEPRARANDLAGGLEARTADPLWMLTRQWQTGEFDGEDAGSPIQATLTHSTQVVDRMRLGDAADVTLLPKSPLETTVEAERVPLDWRLRVQIGQQFERFARTELKNDAGALAALIDGLRSKYPVRLPSDEAWTETDRATRRIIAFMAGRVIDGGLLMADIEAGALVPPAGVSAEQLAKAVARLTKWYAALFVQPSDSRARAWRNQQLDYRFELNPPQKSGAPATAQDRMHLIAPDYRNGALEWHSFSAASAVPGAPLPGEWQTSAPFTAYPTRIAVGGTSPRWWAFEDAATDFGALDVPAPDLAKLLLMEFVLIYGDDWFSVPVEVNMPSLVRIDKLTVREVFDDALPIQSPIPPPIPSVNAVVRDAVRAARGNPDDPMLRWEMFTLASHSASDPDAAGIANVLLVPPVSGFRDESDALEEVRFLRDEGANLVWGVEHIVMNQWGRPVHGFDAQRERAERTREAAIATLEASLVELEGQLAAIPAGASDAERGILIARMDQARATLAAFRGGTRPAAQNTVPLYRLATTVPENWIPFTPASASHFFELAQPSIRLQRAQMLRNSADQDPTPIGAMTTLLSLSAAEPLMWLEEATVLRSGLRVQLTAQRTRGVDGKTYVWLGRKVLTGRGEGASGLKFDVLQG